jgi:hypothetical protein
MTVSCSREGRHTPFTTLVPTLVTWPFTNSLFGVEITSVLDSGSSTGESFA